MSKEKEKAGEKIIYGGPCYTGDSKKGFLIFAKKGGKWERMVFGVKGMILFDKVKGGIYEITGLTERGANFGRFAPTGEVSKDPEVLDLILKNEIQYKNLSQENTATAAMKKHEHTIERMTLGELKVMAKKDYRLGYAIKKWVENNF